MITPAFETTSVRMQQQFNLRVTMPAEDVERVMERVCAIVPLTYGAYDRVAFQSAASIERYRPLDGAIVGVEAELRRRPGVVEVSFDVQHDPVLLAEVIEAIYQVHSYQEPVIKVQEVLASRTKGLDDKANPHRWWNQAGDWKVRAAG